jgi:hypothetical protein
MIVLSIIGGIVGLMILSLIIMKLNEYSNTKYKYEIFNIGNFSIAFIANCALFFGNSWYQSALSTSGDLLNGQILISIGIVILLFIVYKNISNTSFEFGMPISIFQLLLYGVASVFLVFGILIALAWLGETKPVYNLNK